MITKAISHEGSKKTWPSTGPHSGARPGPRPLFDIVKQIIVLLLPWAQGFQSLPKGRGRLSSSICGLYPPQDKPLPGYKDGRICLLVLYINKVCPPKWQHESEFHGQFRSWALIVFVLAHLLVLIDTPSLFAIARVSAWPYPDSYFRISLIQRPACDVARTRHVGPINLIGLW